MIDLIKLVKDRKYPTNIRDGIKPVLKVKTNIEKIFSKFGLNDFRVGLNKKQKKMISDIDKELECNIIEKLHDDGVRLITENLKLINKVIDVSYYGLSMKPNKKSFITLSKNKNLKIVFSTNPWDIATMSMRGITSCMEWNSNNSITLSGSIVDPCVAVMYLTDGTKTKHGEKMLARSVVRFTTINNKEPQILIENSYIANYFWDLGDNDNYFIEDGGINDVFDKVFLNLLKDKLKNKIQCKNYLAAHTKIPKTPEVNSLNTLNLSYRDSGIVYSDNIVNLDSLIPQKQPKKKSAAKSKKK